MNVGAGVVGVRRPWVCHSLCFEEGGGQLLGKLTVGAARKEIARSVDIDHRHARTLGEVAEP